jgi:hypothetical protein
LVLFGAVAIVILSLLGGVGSHSEVRHQRLIVDLLMLQHDWYWDQLVHFYGDRIQTVRSDGFFDRVDSVVAHLNLVTVGDLSKVEY